MTDLGKSLWKLILLRWFFKFLYVAGLTLVFPFVYLVVVPVEGTSVSIIPISVALILISISFVGLFFIEGGLAKTFRSLATATLIPGIIGIFFSFFSRDLVFNFLQSGVGGERAVFSLNRYVELAVPKIQLITVAYVVLGVLLWFYSYKFKKK